MGSGWKGSNERFKKMGNEKVGRKGEGKRKGEEVGGKRGKRGREALILAMARALTAWHTVAVFMAPLN